MTAPRLRQLVIAAESLDAADQLRELLGLGEAYPDPGVAHFGLVNAVFSIGDQFLEVIVPTTDDAPARRHIDRNGEGGYMAIFQCDDITVFRDRVDGLGMRRVWNADHDVIAASHVHPADIGGAIVSVDEPRPPESWLWGGPDWEQNSVPGALTGATLTSPDPAALAGRWGQALDVQPESADLQLADAVLHFAPGEANALTTFEISLPDVSAALDRAKAMDLAVDGQTVTLAGTKLALV